VRHRAGAEVDDARDPDADGLEPAGRRAGRRRQLADHRPRRLQDTACATPGRDPCLRRGAPCVIQRDRVRLRAADVDADAHPVPSRPYRLEEGVRKPDDPVVVVGQDGEAPLVASGAVPNPPPSSDSPASASPSTRTPRQNAAAPTTLSVPVAAAARATTTPSASVRTPARGREREGGHDLRHHDPPQQKPPTRAFPAERPGFESSPQSCPAPSGRSCPRPPTAIARCRSRRGGDSPPQGTGEARRPRPPPQGLRAPSRDHLVDSLSECGLSPG